MPSKEEFEDFKYQHATCKVQTGLLEPITEYWLPHTSKLNNLGVTKPLISGIEEAMEANEGISLGVPGREDVGCVDPGKGAKNMGPSGLDWQLVGLGTCSF